MFCYNLKKGGVSSMKSDIIDNNKNIDIAYIGLFAALIAICSWISVPSTVPFTLQTMGVFITIGILGGKRGTCAILVYILLGAIGIPVFAGFSGGLGVLFGTTGGYIFGFLFSALVMWAIEKLFKQTKLMFFISMIIGLIVCYIFGTAFFIMVYTKTSGDVAISAVLGWCVIPFIVPDLIKIVISFILTERLKKALKWKIN